MKNRPFVHIEPIKNYMHYIPQLAIWFHKEWGHLYPDRTVTEIEKNIEKRIELNQVPTVLVAHHETDEKQNPIGAVAIKEHDMDTRTDLSFWLASLYVDKEHRGRGIGARLVHAAECAAQQLGIQTLHLFTPDAENFYSKIGWEEFSKERYNGADVTIMKKDLSECQ